MEPANAVMSSSLPKAGVKSLLTVSEVAKDTHLTDVASSESATPILESPSVLAAEADTVGNHKKRETVQKAVQDVNELFQATNRTLEFKLDEDSQHMVIQVKDVVTKEVIRQIPSEDVLKLAKSLEQFKGMLFEEIA